MVNRQPLHLTESHFTVTLHHAGDRHLVARAAPCPVLHRETRLAPDIRLIDFHPAGELRRVGVAAQTVTATAQDKERRLVRDLHLARELQRGDSLLRATTTYSRCPNVIDLGSGANRSRGWCSRRPSATESRRGNPDLVLIVS